MKTQIYLLITLTFLISITSCKDKRIIDLDALASDGATNSTGAINNGVRITATNTLKNIIEGGTLAGLEVNTDSLVTNTLTHLTTSANYESAKIEARYATENGAGANNGTSWANAWAATNLRGGINGISDASATKVYAVLVASGTYKPTDGTDRNISFAMNNHVAIIGGFTNTGSWERNGTTTFSGDIGTEGSTSDNSYQVFSHDGIPLDNGLLYGVTITKGNATSGSPQNRGAGMYNKGSSPRVVNVRFTDNTIAINTGGGAGMYNDSSSPRLVNVVFNGNIANNFTGGGGGMYNNSSSPRLENVVFTGNIANQGGGMYNTLNSSPLLVNVVFSRNRANGFHSEGGGMYNNNSSPRLVNVVFNSRNEADIAGGGMFSISSRLLIVNSIFVDNTADSVANGHDIAMNGDIVIAGSVLGVGTANPTNGIVVTNTGSTGGSYNITYHSLKNGAVNFGADAITDTATGGLTYPTIQSTSSALNTGLHVRKNGDTYYFSEDGTTWYTGLLSTGGLDTSKQSNLPTSGVEDLTATDIAGNTRNGRPDAGVHEYR